MATQITHIAIAHKMCPTYLSHFTKRDLFIGTVFPDIRYYARIDRDITHVYDITLDDVVREKSAFMAGVKLHCLVDLVREDYMHKNGMYDRFVTGENKHAIPKLVEDELSYGDVPNWDEVIAYFDDILAEEEAYPVTADQIRGWHTSLQDYFSQPPSNESRAVHAKDVHIPEARVVALNEAVATLRSNPAAIEICRGYYDDIESLLKKHR